MSTTDLPQAIKDCYSSMPHLFQTQDVEAFQLFAVPSFKWKDHGENVADLQHIDLIKKQMQNFASFGFDILNAVGGPNDYLVTLGGSKVAQIIYNGRPSIETTSMLRTDHWSVDEEGKWWLLTIDRTFQDASISPITRPEWAKLIIAS